MAFEINPVRKYEGARYPGQRPERGWMVLLKALAISVVVAVIGVVLLVAGESEPLERARTTVDAEKDVPVPPPPVEPEYDVIAGVAPVVRPSHLAPRKAKRRTKRHPKR